jgi:hypothetical protein
MSTRPILPRGFRRQEISQLIGQGGEDALRWILHFGTLCTEKYLLSESVGYDIGTPETVKTMMKVSGFDVELKHPELAEKNARNNFGLPCPLNAVIKADKADILYTLLVEGYLLGTNFNTLSFRNIPLWEHPDARAGILADVDGRNQLEGEIRRYWARKTGRATHGPKISIDVIADYCRTNNLSNTADERLIAQLEKNPRFFS